MSLNSIRNFYKQYFLEYWEIKYEQLKEKFEKSNSNHFNSGISEIENEEKLEKRFPTYLKFEIHNMKFQIIEALFSLMFALENGEDINLWFNLTFPPDSSRGSFAIYDKISEVKGLSNMRQYLETEININQETIPLWEHLFFFQLNFEDYEKEWDDIKENLIWILSNLATQFTKRDDYNSYKHGLRCFHSGMNISIRPHNSEHFIPVSSAENGMHFLTKKEEEDNTKVGLTFKAFSPNKDLMYIKYSIELIKNIIKLRRSKIFDEDVPNFSFFDRIDKTPSIDYTLIRSSRTITSSRSIFSYGLGALHKEDLDAAKHFMEKVLQIDENHYPSFYSLGYIHFELEQYDKAIDYFNQYIKYTQGEFRNQAIYNLSLAHYHNGELNKAKEVNSRLLRRDLDDNELEKRARYFQAKIYLDLNQQSFEENGRNKLDYIDQAEKHLEKGAEIEKIHPELWDQLAFLKKILGRYEESKHILLKILEKYPKYLNAFIRIIEIFDQTDNTDEMEGYIERALELNEEGSYIWFLKGKLMEKKNNNGLMLKAFQKSLEFAKNEREKTFAYHNLGYYYREIEDYREALNHFKNALNIDKSFQPSIQGYLTCLWELEKYDPIIEFTEDLDESNRNIQHLEVRAMALSKQEDFESAISLIDRLIELSEMENLTFISLLDSKGDIYKEKGNTKKASKNYKQTLEVADEDYPLLEEIREKLNGTESK